MAADLFDEKEVLYNAEGSFLENASSLGSNTYALRFPAIAMRPQFDQGRADDMTIQARKNESRPGYRTLRACSLELDFYVPALGTDPAATTPAANWWATLLGNSIGASLATDDGGTVSSATDGDTFVSTGATFTKGGIIRCGVKGDGRGDGQPGVIDTFSAGNIQLINALPGTPSASDALRATTVVYPTETNPTTSYRFLMMHKTSGAFYQMLGCRMESVSFEFPIADGGPIRATARFLGAYWDIATPSSPSSFPSGVSLPACDTAVISGGSLVKQAAGTTTRAVLNASTLTLSLDMGLIPEQGPAASQPQFCNTYGWVSTRCVPTISYTVPWSSSGHTEFDSDASSTTHQYFLFASGPQAGRVFGFYMPYAYPVGSRPTVANANGLLHQAFTYRGREGTDTTSDLSRSVIRFFLG